MAAKCDCQRYMVVIDQYMRALQRENAALTWALLVTLCYNETNNQKVPERCANTLRRDTEGMISCAR